MSSLTEIAGEGSDPFFGILSSSYTAQELHQLWQLQQQVEYAGLDEEVWDSIEDKVAIIKRYEAIWDHVLQNQPIPKFETPDKTRRPDEQEEAH